MSTNIDTVQQESPTKGQKITPFLCFDNNAEEAVNFYVSLFDDENGKTGY
jgi:hypothetical protein